MLARYCAHPVLVSVIFQVVMLSGCGGFDKNAQLALTPQNREAIATMIINFPPVPVASKYWYHTLRFGGAAPCDGGGIKFTFGLLVI